MYEQISNAIVLLCVFTPNATLGGEGGLIKIKINVGLHWKMLPRVRLKKGKITQGEITQD